MPTLLNNLWIVLLPSKLRSHGEFAWVGRNESGNIQVWRKKIKKKGTRNIKNRSAVSTHGDRLLSDISFYICIPEYILNIHIFAHFVAHAERANWSKCIQEIWDRIIVNGQSSFSASVNTYNLLHLILADLPGSLSHCSFVFYKSPCHSSNKLAYLLSPGDLERIKKECVDRHTNTLHLAELNFLIYTISN